ncbi:bifunctional diaminohydroxyphosphoribosylaminopyrimidine deaminase/5-amino-6-(5-phosphoribosylamino)uracil reductase RibD [Neptunomonas marina]|uniref:Riboflavin biosynthesis protein RibD n=1 Tax=Neptunomonas marina TaxID=1815562 RepID=A0A437Q600_9GAMM|nr:bifunctional diaminohydroxyphosphoribosylaminopyrimidine deaminase/5-amino-6-(5-phosphoribosylamino)uracil reductase RibD [Neptunomonas marina]RVU29925.1 bifunctional diaminohydroxyphosphoribosylaminopyrimidine deaminase/5-amino-6-(5-phosphoribosylamino)uracil reductase RibD [Neptunomonas marina]
MNPYLDRQLMARAIQLARQGIYTTSPNPRVGCVIAHGETIVGEGYHVRAGEGHAEVNALRQAGAAAKGATAYVTLEPCSHFGRTPPCAAALIQAGVARVVSAMGDPNPQVNGRGIAMLNEAGIATEVGLLENEARALNPGFIKRMTTGRPWVRVKLAMSADGRTAMRSGESQWITGAPARQAVQRLRARSCAVVTGIGSILHDDSALTVRAAELGLANAEQVAERQPLRVVLDRQGQLSPNARILQQSGRTLWMTTSDAERSGAERVAAQLSEASIDLAWVLDYLGQQEQCNEILIEAGAVLAGGFVAAGLVDELVVFMAPTLLGSHARPLVELPLEAMAQQQRLELTDVRQFGDDLRLTYRLAQRG